MEKTEKSRGLSDMTTGACLYARDLLRLGKINLKSQE